MITQYRVIEVDGKKFSKPVYIIQYKLNNIWFTHHYYNSDKNYSTNTFPNKEMAIRDLQENCDTDIPINDNNLHTKEVEVGDIKVDDVRYGVIK